MTTVVDFVTSQILNLNSFQPPEILCSSSILLGVCVNNMILTFVWRPFGFCLNELAKSELSIFENN
jgi:hypothetical protein